MSATAVSAAKFQLGQIVATPNALNHLTQDDIRSGIIRHQSGDWGDLDADDRKENDLALERGTRLLSAYQASNGVKFWIITEADKSSTTVLMPEDY
jgi:hypothetical protein